MALDSFVQSKIAENLARNNCDQIELKEYQKFEDRLR